MNAPRASVVIPAHDEESVILRCLAPLQPAVTAGDLEVVVACNACSDRTADLARSVPGVRVVEIPVASKVAALRAGEATVTAFPRVYLDADVVLRPSALFDVVDQLEDGRYLAGRPALHYATDQASPLVRLFYRARRRMPSVLGRLWGAGVYVLSATGRERFTDFPDVMADDVYVDSLFSAHEITVTAQPPVAVSVPRTTASLARTLVRVQRGRRDRAGGSGAADAAPASSTPALHDLVSSVRGPLDLAAAVVYATLVVVARMRVLAEPARGTWERDGTSR